MYPFLHTLSAFYGSFIIYNLSLAFSGIYLPLKKTIFPVLIYTILIYVYKSLFFNSYPALHTIAITFTCIVLIKVISKIPWHLSLIGVILTSIIISFASNLFICPIALYMGLSISCEIKNSFDWVLLSFLETTPALLIYLWLRSKKSSILEFLNNIN